MKELFLSTTDSRQDTFEGYLRENRLDSENRTRKLIRLEEIANENY